MTINAATPAPQAPATDLDPAAKPYGLLGLAMSSVCIIAASTFVCCLLALAAFGIAALVSGTQRALDIIITLNPTGAKDKTFVTQFNIVVGLVIYAVTSSAILAAARIRGRSRWRDLVAWRPWLPLRGARLFWIILGVTLVYSFMADNLVEHVYPRAKDWTPSPSGTLWDALFIGLAAIMAPLTEELFFRGWLYTALRPVIGVVATIALTSLLFALAHWENTHLYALAIFPVGLALGFVRERTGSIAASITFHALYNGVASVLLLTK